MTAVIDIRPRGNGDVEETADDETASGTVGDKRTHNSFSGSGIVKNVKNRRRSMSSVHSSSSLSLVIMGALLVA